MLDPIKVGFAPVGVAIQDMNGDDQSDLVVVNRDSNSLSLFIGNGKGFVYNRWAFWCGCHTGRGGVCTILIKITFQIWPLPVPT